MKIETDDSASTEAATPSHHNQPSKESHQTVKKVDKAATAPPGNQTTGSLNNIKALSTPAVRHHAKKENIDINKVPGTGKDGRVTKEDIINFMKKGSVNTDLVKEVKAEQQTSSARSYKIAPLTGTTEKDQ